jgi:hypothetical protein
VQAHARVQSVSLEATRPRKNKEMGFAVLEVVYAEITYRSQQSDEGDRHLETNHDPSPLCCREEWRFQLLQDLVFSLKSEIQTLHQNFIIGHMSLRTVLNPSSRCSHALENLCCAVCIDAHVPRTLINHLAPFHIYISLSLSFSVSMAAHAVDRVLNDCEVCKTEAGSVLKVQDHWPEPLCVCADISMH